MMNMVFRVKIGEKLKVYVEYMIVKSGLEEVHDQHL